VSYGQIIDTYTYTNPDGSPAIGPMSNQTNFTAYKDPGTYTINVSAVAWIQQGRQPTTVTLTDQLTVQVEAPQVTTFFVEGKAARFDTMSTNGHNGTAGIGVLTWQANDTPGFMFHAAVTNGTHYDATVGFIQVVQPNRSGTYAGRPSSQFSSSTNMWDGTNPNATAVWYNNMANLGYWTIPAGQSLDLSNNGYPFTYIDDSPFQGFTPQDNNGNLLRALSINDTYQTSVAVMGGRMPGGNPTISGIPIALSTATWFVGGSGTTTAATAQLVMDPNQWNRGALTPAAAQNYNGDGTIRFLTWTGNGPAALVNFNTQSGGASMGGMGTMPFGRLGGIGTMPSDRLSVVPVPLAVIAVPPEASDVVMPFRRWAKRKPT
jgi:hypothetical protein